MWHVPLPSRHDLITRCLLDHPTWHLKGMIRCDATGGKYKPNDSPNDLFSRAKKVIMYGYFFQSIPASKRFPLGIVARVGTLLGALLPVLSRNTRYAAGRVDLLVAYWLQRFRGH